MSCCGRRSTTTGNLDWYALEHSGETRLDPAAAGPVVAPTRSVQTFIPTQVVFDGMPNTRWWAFEDRRTNFGEVSPGHDRRRQVDADGVRA